MTQMYIVKVDLWNLQDKKKDVLWVYHLLALSAKNRELVLQRFHFQEL